MKKRLYILLAILAACFIACNGEKNIEVPPPYDPAWVGRYVWKNESTHAITMSVFGDVDFRNKLLPAGGEITVENR